MRVHRFVSVLALLGLLLGGLFAAAPGVGAGVAQAEACFAETGFCVRGRFLDYWTINGGLARNGYPLSEERRETLDDGNEYTVQYFERVRLELHPENQPPYDVLLGQFGRRVLSAAYADRFIADDYRTATAPVGPLDGAAYFPETGHNLSGRFLAYWEANGGLAQFGYPITEERNDTLGGVNYRTQYFERGRMEHHPEYAGTPYEVLLGQFGREILRQSEVLTGDFGRLYLTNADVRERLGTPFGKPGRVPAAYQAFERGMMFWLADDRNIYVLCGSPDAGGIFTVGPSLSFHDDWDES